MGPDTKKHLDEGADEAGEESFPASDPPSWTLGIEPDEDQTDQTDRSDPADSASAES